MHRNGEEGHKSLIEQLFEIFQHSYTMYTTCPKCFACFARKLVSKSMFLACFAHNFESHIVNNNTYEIINDVKSYV